MRKLGSTNYEQFNSPEVVDKLVNDNLALAKFFAQKLMPWDYDEGYSLGLLGLFKAAQRYNQKETEHECAFGTFAAIWIKQQIKRPRTYEIRQKRGGPDKIELSFDAPLGDHERWLGEIISDPNAVTGFESMLASEKTAHHDNASVVFTPELMKRLPEFERRIIEMRFGFGGEAKVNLEEIAEKFGCSRERIRQLETVALQRLKIYLTRKSGQESGLQPKEEEKILESPATERISVASEKDHICSDNSKRFGFYESETGKWQRMRCNICGETWNSKATQQIGNNRIPYAKHAAAVKLLKQGTSAHATAHLLGINKNTALRIQRRVAPAFHPDGNKDDRERTEYFKQYKKEKPHVNTYQRIHWRDAVRASLELILAESHRPLHKKEIFTVLKSKYPDLKMCALGYMLQRDCEEQFECMGEYYSYRINPWFVFHDGWPKDKLAARAAYFRRLGVPDEAKVQYDRLQRDYAAAQNVAERLAIVDRIRETLVLFNTASSIINLLTPKP